MPFGRVRKDTTNNKGGFNIKFISFIKNQYNYLEGFEDVGGDPAVLPLFREGDLGTGLFFGGVLVTDFLFVIEEVTAGGVALLDGVDFLEEDSYFEDHDFVEEVGMPEFIMVVLGGVVEGDN